MTATTERWAADRAHAWYGGQALPYGFNFLPSSAVNSTEMWQAETFDPATIDRELALAAACGFNSCRVFVQYLVWRADPAGFRDRFAAFLASAARHGLSVVPILFDDCAFAGKEPHLGSQDAPVPGLHNSGWTPSPGPAIADDLAAGPHLERYVRDVVGAFATDTRLLLWDLYNEPGNGGRGSRSLPLLRGAFAWARAAGPTHPLTSAAWGGPAAGGRPDDAARTDAACLALSDIVSFHQYEDAAALATRIAALERRGYPIICTEWMARPRHSVVATHLPLFVEHSAGCYLWGLVNGRTQTHHPWGSPQGAAEPDLWFHDLFRPDGAPYDPAEIEAIRRHSPSSGAAASTGARR